MAAGSVVQGMSRQVGNELDEFVTDALRNRLVGLPLDLPAINMARGRSEGIPALNDARRQIFAATNEAALAPYESWADFEFNLKHSESAANFIAAYGTHTHITTLDPDGTGPIVAGSIAARRAAVDQIINGTLLPGPDGIAGDNPFTVCAGPNDPVGCDESADDIPAPADSLDFLTGAGTWANVAGIPVTGLEGIDFWVGGLAEKQAPFGGLLGTTFNFVFEKQMEDLQDGDRFYYLSRTAGLNMLVQLEGNSFSELIMRNTTARALPAEVFARPDFSFTVGKLGTSGPILDDAATAWDESALLTRNSPTAGTIRFAGGEHVIWYGTANADRVYSSEGDDTIRLNNGNDWAEGGAGNDQFIGGAGNDILNDNFGDDVVKGGPGNDAISSGQGFDLNQGGTGHDFVVGGSDPTETFGGPGNDIIFAGQSSDTVFGDDGDDWIEGGNQADLLQGDNGAPFQNDPNAPGHDVIIGDGGNDDYDSEGGDDIMVAGPGIERNEGMLGFDWVTYRGDPQAADADMFFTGLLPPDLDNVKDRFDLTEGLSGWNFDDKLRGTNDDALTLGTDHQLTTAGIARVNGLAAILPDGATSFNAGNIILGGAGSDLMEGRGGDDIIDGDRWLNVQLSDGSLAADSLHAFRARVFAGTLDPGTISIVRSIVSTGALASNVDTAVYSGPFAEYDLTFNANGSVTVDHTGAPVAARSDGRDTLWNVEQLSFCDAPGLDQGSCDVPRTIIVLVPVADPSPASPGALAFGDVTSGTTSAAQSITINNDGIAPLTVSSATLGGPDAASFVVTNGCTIVAPAGSCTIDVAFAPTALGAASATLTIVHNAAGSPLTYALSGMGVLFINTPASGTVTIDDTTPAEDQLLTVSEAIVDPDGIGPITFTWQAETAPAVWTPVGTGATFTPGDAQVGQALRVVATFNDLAAVPVAESVTSAATAPVTNVNDAPVGTPVLLDALQAVWPQESTVITAGTAGITDADGLGTFSYQWQQRGGGAFANIVGATASTFTPTQAQVSQRLRVVVTYTDLRGTLETLNSAETTNVVGDVFTGTAGADLFAGTAGRDNASGLASADNLSGGLGPDTINGGGGADAINAGDGDDIVIGNGGDDTVSAGAGNDVIRVGLNDGFDAVTGGAGTDQIVATADGTVIGLSSLATVESITSNGFTGVTIAGNGNANTLNFAAVTLTGIGSIDGAGGADAITGTNLPDILLGGAGADNVAGGGGDDTITGGAGNDAMNGNAGLDTFVFEATFGADTITGFDANPTGGQDLLDISALGITSATFAANVTFAASGGGANTVVTIVGGGTITVLGAAPAGAVAQRVTIADFILAP
jgi:Ca2+-binding RTX toxin-like protein